ncbi:exopolyphosphatase [Ferriphaselus sp. R-1]|uniref:exopolyphosphatase n=1 Tax=Ferriphaselus sp. R-1 TaxID=1485544 RepID=UPI000557B52D|nr:exopolyphosphatase [Ferriphaselus sp. R-1]
MLKHSVLAAIDLGSNSFHLEIARVINDQIFPLDTLREPVRLASGLTADKRLDEETQQRALACLTRFGERLRQLPPGAVRAVGTNSLRVAKNAHEFLLRAEAALGFPIEIIAGREEARLIYLGVANNLPPSSERRLVVDIGGGSTELIIGSGTQPEKLESLYMGCVSYTLRFFPDGKITKKALLAAELAARNELQSIVSEYSNEFWHEAIGSSGTARTLAGILQRNGWSDGSLTQEGLVALRNHLLKIGDTSQLDKLGFRADRLQVLPGGFAIMYAIMTELDIPRLTTSRFALRDGILHDLLGRFHDHDVRDVTVSNFMQRYQVDPAQAQRVERLAGSLLTALTHDLVGQHDTHHRMLGWAARLHEIGLSIAHSGHHKHAAYILVNADMPGFSRDEQEALSHLVLAHRGSLRKMNGSLQQNDLWRPALALRLAALLYRSRNELSLPSCSFKLDTRRVELSLSKSWLKQHPLTLAALEAETAEWPQLGIQLKLRQTDQPG